MLLVTGANGFLGRHLVATLVARNLPVRRAVRALAPADGDSSSAVAVGDLDGNTDWAAALAGVDTLVHLAALAHLDIRRVPDALATYRRVNTVATLRLADAAVLAGVRRFVFVSSVKVNGDSSGTRPFSADDTPAPDDPYGVSKLEAEVGLRSRAGKSMRIAIVRPPLVYGPGVRANFLRLMELVERGIPLPFASIDNRRSLVSVENLCDLLLHLACDPQATEGTFYVSDGDDLSTPELIRRIARALHRPARLLPFPPALLGMGAKLLGQGAAILRLRGSLQVDLAETRRRLGWSPPVAMDDALARTAHWFHEQAGKPR
jgi:nucleoside-diphosphate-sugar epimerase